MLEHRSRPLQALLDWIATTLIFQQALQCEGDAPRAQQLAHDTVQRLLADGVLQRQLVDGGVQVRMADTA